MESPKRPHPKRVSGLKMSKILQKLGHLVPSCHVSQPMPALLRKQGAKPVQLRWFSCADVDIQVRSTSPQVGRGFARTRSPHRKGWAINRNSPLEPRATTRHASLAPFSSCLARGVFARGSTRCSSANAAFTSPRIRGTSHNFRAHRQDDPDVRPPCTRLGR